MQQRDFKVISIGLKGKAKTPTVTLESMNGDKLVLKLEDKLQLAPFEIDAEYTIEVVLSAQRKLLQGIPAA